MVINISSLEEQQLDIDLNEIYRDLFSAVNDIEKIARYTRHDLSGAHLNFANENETAHLAQHQKREWLYQEIAAFEEAVSPHLSKLEDHLIALAGGSKHD